MSDLNVAAGPHALMLFRSPVAFFQLPYVVACMNG